jgi:hypothetical protein
LREWGKLGARLRKAPTKLPEKAAARTWNPGRVGGSVNDQGQRRLKRAPRGRASSERTAVALFKADPECCLALEQILQLARKGDSASGSEEDLLFFIFLAVKSGRRTRYSSKADFERTFARFTGKTWKALSEFPARLRRTAEEVERVGGSHFFDPARAIKLETPLAIYARREFPKLPTTLANYARWLEAQVKGISRMMRRFYRRGRPGQYSSFILNASEQVKLIAGRFCDRQVADLLNAADRVLHPGDSTSGIRFDEQGIALLRSRQKHKTLKT